VTSRAKVLAGRALDVALERQGYQGADLELARGSVKAWAWARRQTRGRRGSVVGLGVVVPRPGRAELVPFEVPLAGPGEVTVEILASGVSPGTERAQWLRLPNAQPQLPYRPGYSGAGRVLAVGSDVTHLAPGDLAAVPRTAHASVATVPAEWAVRVPPGVPLEQAALVYLAIISGYGVRRAELEPGQSVCVLGSGPIGALALRLAKLSGAGSLLAVARSSRHEDSARSAGARFRTVGGGLVDVGADVVIDATGDPAAIGDAVTATRDGGTVVLLGSPRGISPAVPVGELQRRRLRLVGAHVSALAKEAKRTGGDPFSEIAATFLAGVAAGEVPAADLAGEPVDPREITLMYRRLAGGSLSAAHLDWRRLPAQERAQRRAPLRLPVLPSVQGQVAPQVPAGTAVTTRPLRFAVIGCGDIGTRNARAVARATNAELVLVQDAVPALAEATARAHGGAVVASLTEALDPARVDAVLLSVPHDLHLPLVEQAAAAGLHVVVEKPLAVDLASARACVEAADKAGVVLSVCFPYRYEAAPAAAHALADAGAIGAFRGAAVLFHADKPPSYWHGGFSGRARSDWRASRARSGGGVMIMNLTHHVDLLRHVTGCEALEVTAHVRRELGQEVEDGVVATVRFDGGAIGTLSASASTRGAPPSRVELWGELGTLQLEPEPRVYTDVALPGVLSGRWNTLPTDPVDERTVYVERFASAVLEGREPDVTGEDGVAVQALVEAVYRSAESGGPEQVEPVRLTS
jgi:predicted dehydrogenase/NADPH:quinone reductase-like Zn-dependent oxidoreductase